MIFPQMCKKRHISPFASIYVKSSKNIAPRIATDDLLSAIETSQGINYTSVLGSRKFSRDNPTKVHCKAWKLLWSTTPLHIIKFAHPIVESTI